MIQIQSTCSTCEAQLELAVVDLLVLLPLTTEPVEGPRLVHDCPECGATCLRTVAWKLAKLLMAHGVAAVPDLELEPAVEPHPENPPAGPVLTADEIIDLHDVLSHEDWFDELVAVGPTA
jgi:hypothetical protein